MKTRVLLLLILAPLACAPRAAAQSQPGPAAAAAWSRYTYPGEEFSAELPAMPLVYNTDRQVGGDWRKGYEKVRVFNLYSDGVIYFVVAYDKPHGEESFDFFAASLRGAWGLVPKDSLSLGGFEGRSYQVVGGQRWKPSQDVYGEARAFRTKNHAYLALALATERGRPEIERFLNSFALGATPSGEQIAAEEPVRRYVAPKKDKGAPSDAVAVPARAPGETYLMKELERKAVIVYKPEPPFTEEARQKDVTGVVRLRVVLSSEGQVVNPEVLQALRGGLTESALRVARQMRFFPAQKDGHPVSQYIVLEYNFNIY